MKKNKTMQMILITLLIAMIALVLVSGTYAQYTSSASGSDTARVAKWSFIVGEDDIVLNNTFKFNLFNTINDSNGTDEEEDVVSANSDKVIAPGTSGNFKLVLENKSETSAKYGITYTVTNTASIPVKFSVNGTDWKDSLDDVVADDVNTKIDANTGSNTINIQWKWAYEGDNIVEDDITDVNLGKTGTAKLIVKADVTVTQIN